MWFGMDPLIEMQQMGVAPPLPSIELSPVESDNLKAFYAASDIPDTGFDHVTASGDVVVAFNPPQHEKDASTRRVEMYRFADDAMNPVYSHEIATTPSYAGDPSIDTALSRAIVDRWFGDVLNGHDMAVLAEVASPNILIHPTAMPCEATYVGLAGATRWLEGQWGAFSDLSIVDYSTVASSDIVAARWSARGTSSGQFLILPPTGETVEYTGVSMYRVEDGRIAEIWETRNTIGIMHQLNPQIGELHAH
jgi:predicted ester cyclase